MHSISVREPSGIELVHSLCGRTDVVAVIDPTLLLSKQYYNRLIGTNKLTKKVLFSYMLHGNYEDSDAIREKIAANLALKIVKCDARKTKLHPGYVLPTPIEWLAHIRDASFVVTNSFHCVVFCLIFHTPFVALLVDGHIGPMNSRIEELLGSVGHKCAIIRMPADITKDLIFREVNWLGIDNNILILRKFAIDYLSKQGL
jgi:hypothetical protein